MYEQVFALGRDEEGLSLSVVERPHIVVVLHLCDISEIMP